MSRSDRISPTAYATGYFWYRHGLSHEALATPQGKRLDRRFRFLIGLIRALSGVSLEAMLLARHRGIDALLTRAIDAGRVGQVIEIAAGLTGRGVRFVQRYPQLTYVETDLPQMAATKQRLLGAAGLTSPRHRVVVLDALAHAGPQSLAGIAATLDPNAGTAIITEGLLSYLEPEDARALWRRIAATLKGFPHGLYLADLYLRGENISLAMLAFRSVLQRFVRGRMYTHFTTLDEATRTLEGLGFAGVAVHLTRSIEQTRELATVSGSERVRVLEART